MNDYVIVTDSSADLDAKLVQELGVEVIPLSFTIGGETYHNYPDNRDMDPHLFYERLRAQEVATTAAINTSDVRSAVEPQLKAGKDVLFLAFSSGLSASCQSAKLTAQELSAEYPDRKIFVVDSLCASLGQGLFVYHVTQAKKAGKTIEEARDYAEEVKWHLCHWFTVDDLHFLKRGGRISGATAMLGTMLSIKPVLHVDNEGHLISISKARGRLASIKGLADKMEELGEDVKDQTIFISHGDCLGDAQTLAKMITDRFGVPASKIHIGYVGPVIGAHSGPGTLALFFLGKNR